MSLTFTVTSLSEIMHETEQLDKLTKTVANPRHPLKMKKLRSELAWSSADCTAVRGKDLPWGIPGHLNLGEMAFVEITWRVPDARESKLFNALVVTLVERGVTPSALDDEASQDSKAKR